jgi:RNA:NAD 2'-phosphotransferase (TPT1/KptA family)
MIQLKDTKELLRTKSYNSSAQTVVDENHEVLLGKLLSYALRHQVSRLE